MMEQLISGSSMIFKEECICYRNCYGYHITEEQNMRSIKELGLKPLCGPRSESVGDIRKAIYFFLPETHYSIYDWINLLYQNKDIQNLKLLRFNLMRRKLYEQCAPIGDFFVLRPISPEKIEYATILDFHDTSLPLNSDPTKIKKVTWNPISKYQIMQEKMD